MNNEIEKIFLEEVKEKKRIGSGVHHKKGKRGYVGSVRTALDLLKGKEKRQYKKVGRVKRYVSYDIILSYENFLKLPDEEKTIRLSEWRKNFQNKEIAEQMGIELWRVYDLYKKYNVPPKQPKNYSRSKKQENHETKDQVAVALAEEQTTRDGLFLQLEGVYKGNIVSERILKLASLLETENARYKIKLTIEEME